MDSCANGHYIETGKQKEKDRIILAMVSSILENFSLCILAKQDRGGWIRVIPRDGI